MLPTLDAIHLLSVLSIQADLTAFVSYATRLITAAATAGTEAVQPSTSTLA
jgi:hypothetical protein